MQLETLKISKAKDITFWFHAHHTGRHIVRSCAGLKKYKDSAFNLFISF